MRTYFILCCLAINFEMYPSSITETSFVKPKKIRNSENPRKRTVTFASDVEDIPLKYKKNSDKPTVQTLRDGNSRDIQDALKFFNLPLTATWDQIMQRAEEMFEDPSKIASDIERQARILQNHYERLGGRKLMTVLRPTPEEKASRYFGFTTGIPTEEELENATRQRAKQRGIDSEELEHHYNVLLDAINKLKQRPSYKESDLENWY